MSIDSGLRMLEEVGGKVQELGIAERGQPNAATALMSFVLGLVGQRAAGARLFPRHTDRIAFRKAFLETITAKWAELDRQSSRSCGKVAAVLPEHHDRASNFSPT